MTSIIEGKRRQRTLSAASITSKFKWSSSKESKEVIPPVPRLVQPTFNRRESEGLGMWDNNDSAFLKELAMEQSSKKSKRLSVLSFKSSSNSETKVKQRPKSVLISPKKPDTFGIATSPPLDTGYSQTAATARTSTYTKRSSIATSTSPSSTLLTFPSPLLRQIDLSLHLPGNEDNEDAEKINNATADEKVPSLLVNGQQGRTRERIVAREPAVRPPKSPRRVNSVYNGAEERARQASLPKALNLEVLPAQRKGDVPIIDHRSRVVSIPNSEIIPSRSSMLVHGLKKKFGRGAHLTKGMEESSNSLGIDFSETFRRGSAGLTPAIEKVPTVNSIHVPAVAPASFAQYSFPSARPAPIRRTSSSSRGLLKKVVSQDGLKTGNILKHPSIDSLSSRFLTRARDSGVSSHSRESSQHSFIEHTSFDEARSGSFTPTSMASSHLFERQKANKLIRDEEAREELRGYPTSRRELSPQRASYLNSPIRPSRLTEDCHTNDATSDRGHHMESKFNAAHEKRWIAASNTYPSYWNSGRRGSDGVTEVLKAGQNHSLHKMHSVDGLTMESRTVKGSSTNCIPPLPTARGSLTNQVTHRRSDRSLNLSKKQSLKSLHISRPTTIMTDSTSADLFEAVSAPADAHEVLSADMPASTTSTIRRIRGQERKKQVPSPLQSNSAQTPPRSPRSIKQNSPRHTRSAGGWIEQPPTTFGSSTRSPTSSTFARMQQEHISHAIKRPNFDLDMQEDAAAAFDCIPSPDSPSSRIRTKSSPTLCGLDLTSHDSVDISDSIKSELSSPSIGEAYTPLSAKLELDPDVVFNGTVFRADSISRSPSDCRELPLKKSQGNIQNLLFQSPPRPIHADAPESPTEEVEVLEDEGDEGIQHHHHHHHHPILY